MNRINYIESKINLKISNYKKRLIKLNELKSNTISNNKQKYMQHCIEEIQIQQRLEELRFVLDLILDSEIE